MTVEEIKTLDAITTKFAQELGEFKRTQGTINAGYVTGLFRKLAAEYSSQQRTEGIKEGFEAAREIDPLSNFQHNILYPTVDDYLNSK